jgi:hypothetical protein
MAKKKKSDTNKTGVAIPIEWYIPDGLITPFATNMVVQSSGDAFKVLFFEVKSPFLLDESATPPSKVRADCVGSVVITPDKLPKIIEVFQSQLDRYLSKKDSKKEIE